MPQDQLNIVRTRKVLAYRLEVGDTFAMHFPVGDQDEFEVSLYTVTEIHELRPEDETVTVTVAYQYTASDGVEVVSGGTRVLDLKRMQFLSCI